MDNRLETILLKAKEDVYSHLSGGNLSKILGQGYDFSELREYERGDDIRHISWINSAKLGQPYVKKMHEERELNVAICTLLDGRFLVGEKRELLLYIMAILSYSAYESNELLTLIDIDGKEINISAPTKNIYSIETSIANLHGRGILAKKVDYSQLSNLYLEQRQLLFLLGDFLDFVDLSLLAQKHEIIVVVIRDKEEERPTLSLEEQLIDPQTNQILSQSVGKRALEYYRDKLMEHDEKLFQHLNQHAIRYIKIYKKSEVIKELERLFL